MAIFKDTNSNRAIQESTQMTRCFSVVAELLVNYAQKLRVTFTCTVHVYIVVVVCCCQYYDLGNLVVIVYYRSRGPSLYKHSLRRFCITGL